MKELDRKMKKKTKLQIQELQKADRIFQLDRDTFVFYLGRSLDDIAPLVRLGSGADVPLGILPHIENTLILNEPPGNISQELRWFWSALQQGLLDKICHIGSSSYINEVYKIAQFHLRKLQVSEGQVVSKKKASLVAMNLARFGPPPPPALSIPKDKAVVHQMGKGNFVLMMGATRVFDTAVMNKQKISLDKEYELMEDVLSKQACRLEGEEHRSFIWLQREDLSSEHPFIYWNLMGKGVALNPCLDPHHAFFEQRIRAKKLKAFLAYDMDQAGFTECLRRKHIEKDTSILYTASHSELVNSFRKIYSQTRFRSMHDGEAIPTMKETKFFTSRTRSHGVFSWLFDSEQEAIVQILFPLGASKPRRNFDLIRAPHDVELQLIRKRKDVNHRLAHLALQIEAGYSKTLFGLLRLREWRYPLIPNKEYIYHQTLKEQDEFFKVILSCFIAVPQLPLIQNFLLLHRRKGLEEDMLEEAFVQMEKMFVPHDDFVLRHNLGIYFRFICSLPAYRSAYTKKNQRRLKKLCLRYSPRFISYLTWLGLADASVEFHILLSGGQASYLFARPIAEEGVPCYKMPSRLGVLEEEPRLYSRQLRAWERALDRSNAPESSRKIVTLLEKFYEEKLRLLGERLRFRKLMDGLGLNLSIDMQTSSMSVPLQFIQGLLPFDIASSFHKFLSFVGLLDSGNSRYSGWWSNVLRALDSSRLPYSRHLLVLLLSSLLVFGSYRLVSCFVGGESVSVRGDSSAEIAATRLVASGDLQREQNIPGAGSILTPLREISEYVNYLAKRNGFRSMDVKTATQQLRDPDIIFPGDLLKLPDLRQARVNKGEYIWEIARVHYRNDFARLKIFKRQIYALLEDGKKTSEAKKKLALQKKALMKRLAATARMRSFLKQTAQEMKRLLSL